MSVSDLETFLAELFSNGRIAFREPPVPAVPGEASVEAVRRIEEAYSAYRLDIAGAPIVLDVGVACAAAEVLRQASWALVCHHDRVEDLARRLTMPRAPATPADHLSADLLLRYLPQVHRRARALNPSDPLVRLIGRVLQQWPLSGVLAGLDEEPAVPLHFGGHEGLMLLYAERLREREPLVGSWRPTGRAAEFVELVATGPDRRAVRPGARWECARD
jgi:hypothetical protein